MMGLLASEFPWTPQSLFQGFPKSLASETWSFSQPWSKDQYFSNVFFSTGAHISRESLHRTQINEIGKFPAAIYILWGSQRPPTFGLQRYIWFNPFLLPRKKLRPSDMPISTQQVSGWARTIQHPQTPSPMLFPDNGLLLTLLLLQVCSRTLCPRIFFLSWEISTDACLLVLRSIHAAISAENTQGPGVQKSHTKVVSVSSAWELSPWGDRQRCLHTQLPSPSLSFFW